MEISQLIESKDSSPSPPRARASVPRSSAPIESRQYYSPAPFQHISAPSISQGTYSHRNSPTAEGRLLAHPFSVSRPTAQHPPLSRLYTQQPIHGSSPVSSASYGSSHAPSHMVGSVLAKRPAPGGPPEGSPPRKHGKWTAEEDACMTELRGNGLKWEDVAARLPGRTALGCRLRYQNYLERRAEWDDERKNKLARLYDRFRKDMWERIGKEMAIPWRAAEAMHWQLGEEEMALRANVKSFQIQAGDMRTSPVLATGSPYTPHPLHHPAHMLPHPVDESKIGTISRGRADSARSSMTIQLPGLSEGDTSGSSTMGTPPIIQTSISPLSTTARRNESVLAGFVDDPPYLTRARRSVKLERLPVPEDAGDRSPDELLRRHEGRRESP